MDEADKSLKAYDKLYQSVPSIGFLSRKKRIKAFFAVTGLAQRMIDEQELTEEQAVFLLSILARKNARFQKGLMMTALNLSNIDEKLLQPIGFKYANEFRSSLQLLPVENDPTQS